MIIQDVDSYSGYMLLYGASENVGGYQIQGTVQKLFNGTVIYDMKYTFNDIMDHEFKYISDQVNYGGLKALQFLNSSITMKDYNFSVSWKDRTILYSDMFFVYQDQLLFVNFDHQSKNPIVRLLSMDLLYRAFSSKEVEPSFSYTPVYFFLLCQPSQIRW